MVRSVRRRQSASMQASNLHRPGPSLSDQLLASALLVALCASACAGSGDPATVAIAEVGGRSILLGEFQPVLERRLEDIPEDASDAVKSRLLDQFLDERVLLEAARRQGIRADDMEVEQALAGLPEEAGPADDAYREEVRSTLTVAKLLRASLRDASSVTREEEAAFYERHADEFHRPAVVVARQILVDEREVADETREMLMREPGRFPILAAERSLSPDRGRRLSYDLANLPAEVAAAIVDLKAGEISPVIPMSEDYLILLLEETREEQVLTLEEARPEIRARLREQKGNGAVERLLADLRERLGLRVHHENLPFAYVEESA